LAVSHDRRQYSETAFAIGGLIALQFAGGESDPNAATSERWDERRKIEASIQGPRLGEVARCGNKLL